ncbi:DUF4244 domain-containing protein [Corynebacterium choanae]|nr:DUF4244 domain-containing protein [Corynebacterium choanae]
MKLWSLFALLPAQIVAVATGVGARLRRVHSNEQGLSTIEYAMCTLAAAALAAVLYAVVTSDHVQQALQGIIDRALNSSPV